MKQQLNISVFGLKRTTINEIKNIIEQLLPEKYQVNWTHLNDTNLQVLLINDVFFDLPNIIEIRKNSQLKTLKIANDPYIQGQLQQNVLYLPVDRHAISLWFKKYVFDLEGEKYTNVSDHAPTHSEMESPTLIEQKSAPAPKIIAPFEYKEASLGHIIQNYKTHPLHIDKQIEQDTDLLSKPLFKNLLPYSCFEMLSEQIWHRQSYRQCVLSIAGQHVILINKTKNQFWLLQKLPALAADHIEIQHADMNTVVKFCHKNTPYDLQQGLWSFIWQNVVDGTPHYTGYYRLRYWPQPLDKQDRNDLFKLAAYFQKGAHIEYVQQQTDLPINFIYKFIFTGLMSQCIYPIDEHDADTRFRWTTQKATRASEHESKSVLGGFFSKLRKKLGI